MVNRTLIRNLEDDDIAGQIAELLPDEAHELDILIIGSPDAAAKRFSVNEIVEGKIIRVDDEHVLVDVGFKSEGSIPRSEWEEHERQPKVGQIIQVLVEELEGEPGMADEPTGLISLSKKKADSIIHWQKIIRDVKEGDIVTGACTRKIKGGLLVDIGVSVFLPASQVDIRRPADIADFLNRFVQCEVLKIDEQRRNIVVSRRSLIEKERQYAQQRLLKELEPGQIRSGVVKNIADFGAFVDLGGIDGLLHITDMAHQRVSHPSEMLKIDQPIDVKVLNVDREKGKVALGIKQLLPNPWENVEERYPVGTVHKGEVVNVMSYGAFVKLEPGIEGLVHISEMSWVKRVNHPSELVNPGDIIDVAVLGVDRAGEQMSLGMKQTQENPWESVRQRYTVDSIVKGKVRNLTNYGAFVELEEGIDGLLHVSDMSWTRKISHPNEMLEKGQEVECKVLAVDTERRRIALGLKQLSRDPWATDIPSKYQPGQVVTGTVTKITNFGVFVGLEDGLEGLLHISELADHKVDNPEQVVKLGDQIEVKILRVDSEERKIGLSRRRVEWNEEVATGGTPRSSDTPKRSGELKGGLGQGRPMIVTPGTDSAEPDKNQ
jgi:small subunit ribosomal protein S1